MRKFSPFFIVFFISVSVQAQWTQHPLNYKYTKQPEFFIPIAMHFSDSSNGFIVNNAALMQYKNQLWQPTPQNISDEFTYINLFTLGPTNTFLCSYDGKIAKYNGDSLSVIFSIPPSTETTPRSLNAIFMTDSTHGWAVGDGGIIIKINGDSITQDSISVFFNFRDVHFDRPDHGWIIGYTPDEFGANIGLVCEYTQGQWVFNSYLDEMLFDIEFSSPDNGFITGVSGIYRYNKTVNQWHPENIPNYYPQYHLSLLNDQYGISVSDNSRNLVYENGTWTDGPVAQVTDLFSVKTTAPGQAWAISQIGNNNPENLNEGKFQRLQDNVWSGHSLVYLDSIFTLPVDYGFTSIAGFDEKNIWLNGQYLQIPADRDWPDTIPTLPSDTFCTAAKIFSDNFGLGTNGSLMEWNGQGWINKNIDNANPDTSFINLSMHVFEDTTAFICRQFLVWASGEFKSVISKYDYSSNSLLHSAELDTRSTFGIHFSDKRNGWCVGDNGLLARYHNELWEVLPNVTEARLNGIFCLDSANAWAVGNSGTLLYYNGADWVPHNLPTAQNLHSIRFTDSTHGWITGDSGLVFRYNGTSWERDTSIVTTNALYAIYMVDSAYGFVGGENGTLLQYIRKDTTTVIITPPVNRICENGSTYFSYNPAGSGYTYQWQVDTGNGFENLTDDTLYSGSLSDTLRIAILHPELYGYLYRCIASLEGVDSVSIIKELIFVNEWIGNQDSTWENPANWSCGSLPGRNTDVKINSGTVVLSSAAAIRSLTAQPGVHISIADGGGLEILH